MSARKNLSDVQFELSLSKGPGDPHGIYASHKGQPVGQMLFDEDTHQVTNIWAQPQRQGIGTGMWNYAKGQGYNVTHSPIQLSKGKKWAKKVGD